MRASIAAIIRSHSKSAPCIASAARVEIGTTGLSNASAMPCTNATASRTPVNAPGPIPTAIASNWDFLMSASASNCSAHGKANCVCCLGAISKRSKISPSIYKATEQASVAVSNANNFMAPFPANWWLKLLPIGCPPLHYYLQRMPARLPTRVYVGVAANFAEKYGHRIY